MTALEEKRLDTYRQVAAEILLQCEQLAIFTATPGKLDRQYLTIEHKNCNDLVAQWMQQAGLHTQQDQAGNICGRLVGTADAAIGVVPASASFLLGSHLDTVPDAGKYDGILGVLLPIAALKLLRERGETFPFNIDVIGFADEEGSRFGTTLLGSRAVAGQWNPQWFALKDAEGFTLEQALLNFGCDPALIATCSRANDNLLGYLEVHIEQGPVLEAAGLPLGIVSSIAGARRLLIDIDGQAGHAGTVPMQLRRDALVVAAKVVLLIEAAAQRHGVVATVGRLQCDPGATNVIPGHCQLSLDIRSGDDGLRDLALQDILDQLQALSSESLRIRWQEIHAAPAVACSEWMQDMLAGVIQNLGLTPLRLLSGAGHDAMCFAKLCAVGMLFVRCEGGISHHPAEAVTQEDVAVALDALCRALLQLKARFV
jgi:allantoate deiminase